MKNVIKFLRSLRRHNDREWFNAHKEQYLKIKDEIEALTLQLIAVLSEYDSRAARLSVKDCTYRIYRDTRFSPDKTPYKTHIGIILCPQGGKKALAPCYYLHLEPDNCMFYIGCYCLPSQMVRSQRKFIYDEIEEYLEIVENPEFKQLFPMLGENKVKTAPQGFSKDWEYIDYLRPRDFAAWTPLDEDFITAPNLAERLRPYFEQGKKYNDFVGYPIENPED